MQTRSKLAVSLHGENRDRILAILFLAVPIVIAQLGSILQGWADTIMVGQYGTPELSAAGFVNNVFNLIIYFLLGVSYASTPVIGDYFSKGEYSAVVGARKSSIIVNLGASIFVVLLLLLLYFNLDRLGQPRELLPLIRPYFLILLSSLPFLAVFNALKQCFDATGDTRTPMWVMLGGNVLNVLLNMVLIYKKKDSYLTKYKGKWSASDAVKLTRLGIPISIQMCLEAGSFNVCALFMGWIGATALAAHQVMCSVSTIGFMIYYGIGAAAAIRIAYFRGQEEWDEVRATSRTALWMSFASALIICLLICSLATPIARAFTTSREVAALFVSFLPAFVAYQIGDCMQSIYANCLRAIEDVSRLMLYAFIAYAVVSVPSAYLFAFPLSLGAVGIWWSFPFGLTTAGILYFFRFRHTVNDRLIHDM